MRAALLLLVPVLAALQIWSLPEGNLYQVELLGSNLS